MAAAGESFAKKVPENVRMLQRVIVKMNEDMHYSVSKTGLYLDKASRYTGLQTKVLEKLKNTDTCKIEFKEIDRCVIYHALVGFYIEQNVIPSTKQLFEALYDKIPPYVDIRSFRKTLVKMGFVWKRKRESSFECVVMERPEIIFERYEYLKHIMQYRSESKTIYFIDENALISNGEYASQKESLLCSKDHPEISQQRVIYAVSKIGVHSVKFIENFDADTFSEWLDSDLLTNVEDDSVIVLDNSKHHTEQIVEPPNKESLKIEICKWLEYHKVPFENQMSKYELLNLTENMTEVNENMYKIDRIIQQRGHSVLRVPECIKKLTPASLFFNLINKNKEVLFTSVDITETEYVEALKSIPKEHFKEFDEFIAGKEKEIFDTDVAVDSVFDHLLDKMKDEPSTNDYDTDIPSCNESD